MDFIIRIPDFVVNLYLNLIFQDVPVGTTPQRVERKFPRKIIEGTPDETRIKDFKSSIDAR